MKMDEILSYNLMNNGCFQIRFKKPDGVIYILTPYDLKTEEVPQKNARATGFNNPCDKKE